MSYPITKYKIYKDGRGKVVAVSSYAGKTVKGVAKCDPRDMYDEELGKKLAAGRCALKIAEKRYKRAKAEQLKAIKEMDKAMKRMNKMNSYLADAEKETFLAKQNLANLLSERGE